MHCCTGRCTLVKMITTKFLTPFLLFAATSASALAGIVFGVSVDVLPSKYENQKYFRLSIRILNRLTFSRHCPECSKGLSLYFSQCIISTADFFIDFDLVCMSHNNNNRLLLKGY